MSPIAREGRPQTGPADYYRLLRVDPDAPRELIAEAYWHLAGGLQNSQQGRSAVGEELEALNEAYATLMNPEHRKAYDATIHRVVALREERARTVQPSETPSRRSRLSVFGRRRPEPTPPHRPDYYATLYVDPSAEPAILGKAYSVLLRLHSNGLAVDARELEEAYATLADPSRRAAYDASRGAPVQSNVPRPSPRISLPPVPLLAPPHAAPEESVSFAEEAASPPPTTAPTAAAELLPPEAPVQFEPSAPAVAEGPAAEPVPTTDQEAPPKIEERHEAGERRPLALGVSLNKLLGLTRQSCAAIRDLVTAAISSGTQKTPQVSDEQVARRLRQHVSPSAETVAGSFREPPSSLARLTLVHASGTEEVLEVGLEPITIGAAPTCDVRLEGDGGAVAPEHARIAYGGARFIIRSLSEDRPTLIKGRPLVWATLENGDEIHIGSWRIRFEMLQQSDVPDHLRKEQPGL